MGLQRHASTVPVHPFSVSVRIGTARHWAGRQPACGSSLAILLLGAFLAAVGWGIVIGNAILPGSCPAPV